MMSQGIMGMLTYTKNKFYFEGKAIGNYTTDVYARDAGLRYDASSLTWTTRNIEKAARLRRFADESAELKFKTHFFTHYPAPESIQYPDHLSPYIFQIESAWHVVTRSPAYVADQPGLGKTPISIMCMNTIPGKVLVVCPSYLKYNWEKELSVWLTDRKRTVTIITEGKQDASAYQSSIIIVPDSLIANKTVQLNLSQHKFEWAFIDEAHRFKDPVAQRTRALIGSEKDLTPVLNLCKREVYLSGTPIPNARPIEIFPLLSQRAPETINWRNQHEYGLEFCGAKTEIIYKGGKPKTVWNYNGESNLKRLRKEMRETLMIRHLKSVVMPELPAKTRQLIFLDQPKKVLKLERKVLEHYTYEDLLGEDYHQGDIARYRREVGLSKIDSAIEIIKDTLTTQKKLVVFAHHIEVVEKLAEAFKHLKPLVIRGGVRTKEKQSRVDLFQSSDDEYPLIFLNLDAGAVGWTLTRAQMVLFVEWSYVGGTNEQGEDRLHRITQLGNVYARYLVNRGLDERMLRSVLRKQHITNVVMN